MMVAFIVSFTALILGLVASYELGRRKGIKQGIKKAQEAYRTARAIAGDMEINEELKGYSLKPPHKNRFIHQEWEHAGDDCILDWRG